MSAIIRIVVVAVICIFAVALGNQSPRKIKETLYNYGDPSEALAKAMQYVAPTISEPTDLDKLKEMFHTIERIYVYTLMDCPSNKKIGKKIKSLTKKMQGFVHNLRVLGHEC